MVAQVKRVKSRRTGANTGAGYLDLLHFLAGKKKEDLASDAKSRLPRKYAENSRASRVRYS